MLSWSLSYPRADVCRIVHDEVLHRSQICERGARIASVTKRMARSEAELRVCQMSLETEVGALIATSCVSTSQVWDELEEIGEGLEGPLSNIVDADLHDMIPRPSEPGTAILRGSPAQLHSRRWPTP